MQKIFNAFLISALSAVTLMACSYVDGVFRSLSFDKAVSQSDFLCLTDALLSEGYAARYSTTNKAIFYDIAHPDRTYNASFRAFERDRNNELSEAPKTIGHRATFGGSEPNSCALIRPVVPLLIDIEKQVLSVCGLSLSENPKQKVRCK